MFQNSWLGLWLILGGFFVFFCDIHNTQAPASASQSKHWPHPVPFEYPEDHLRKQLTPRIKRDVAGRSFATFKGL